jgi:hypothetical protein
MNRVKVAEHGLTFPIVLQKHWELSREYGMFATPMGYLIDEQGIIAAEVAVGGDAILALARGPDRLLRGKLQTRLQDLRKELEIGQAELDKIERQRNHIRETMLRISGAVQVLEELSAESPDADREPKNGGGPKESNSLATNAQPVKPKQMQ